ncbi:1d6c3ee7-b550-4e15-b519-9bf0a20a2806 [Sclerotinia trifoliorum]|uniref:1d6c3ee7-b550-4e15-b519-9bf0a20a2806 n=1 Tax=Sclerotinia trifoliorum TaxID=28548 RepID=A0A8H2ZVR1_9HELO|nr:1d6c3ee7-b550-4e15-b519-9bf0a20a2806 [Sclerotinia trifoliorum]
MAALSVPTVDPVKNEMLNRYLMSSPFDLEDENDAAEPLESEETEETEESEEIHAMVQESGGILTDFPKIQNSDGTQTYSQEPCCSLIDLEEDSDAAGFSESQLTQESEESQADSEEHYFGQADLDEDYVEAAVLPTTFSRFSRLPQKLRRQIWHFARPDARYIKIRESRWTTGLFSDAPIPAMLHTYQESRKVALTWYDLSFARDPEMGFWDQQTLNSIMENALTNEEPREARIYYDWERDGLFSQCARCTGHRMSCRHAPLSFDFRRIKRLAFEGPLSINPFYKIALCFPAVESIMLIRGRSSIRRKAVLPFEFIPVDQRFEWEGEDLLATCLYTIQNTAPECGAIETIQSVQRMTLLNVNQTELVNQEERSYWPCR